ncbi:hypothetical protein AMECASPLE_037370 [Ameca splendens]|uniref:Uncharacterized protein n=1 Tax=Ameca splendens TaxID=208324 RepID=A0ABV0Y7T3_9TELE
MSTALESYINRTVAIVTSDGRMIVLGAMHVNKLFGQLDGLSLPSMPTADRLSRDAQTSLSPDTSSSSSRGSPRRSQASQET